MASHHALPQGTVVGGDYRIVKVLGQGGFGLTYRADDIRLAKPVAIKEYFPADLAVRESSATVRTRASKDEGTFGWGRQKFLDEAKTLARFNQANIVRVARLFEENNTAYMVLDFEEGPNLLEWRRGLSDAPTGEEIDDIAAALLDAVEAVHDAGILHRDIKPQNIIMRDGREPVLIDFGAARQSLGGRSHTVHAVVTPGYSPKEQYALDVERQGPWTDIYALGATFYFLATGRAPADALTRDLGDHEPLDIDRDYRRGLQDAIDAATQSRPEHRPQTVAELRDILFSDGSAATAVGRARRPRDDRRGQRGADGARATARQASARAAAPSRASGRAQSRRPHDDDRAGIDEARPASRKVTFDDIPAVAPEPTRRGGGGLVVVGLLGLAAAVGSGLWYNAAVLAPARDDAAFNRAVALNTTIAFDEYLSRFSEGRHSAEARRRRSAVAQPPTASPVTPPPAPPTASAPPSVAPPVAAASRPAASSRAPPTAP